MPLVRIDTSEQNSNDIKNLSSAIHQALIESFGFPENDFFQIVNVHSNTNKDFVTFGNYLNVERDEGIVYIQIFLRSGHREEKKKTFYKKSAFFIQEKTSIDAKNIFILLSENNSADWSLGNGEAQYL